jgi:predicted phosphodiesterase
MDSIVFDQTWVTGDIFNYGIFSDIHMQPNRPNTKLKRALDKAVSMKAKLIFNGDLADFITVRDPRYNKAKDRAIMVGIINEQIEWVVDFLTPYVEYIDLISMGNHEDVLLKHYGIDVVRFILRDLNRIRQDKGLDPIHYGSYRGFIQYHYIYKEGKRAKNFTIFRHHGNGGSAPVTAGAIDLYRLMHSFDADLYIVGHKHKSSYREDDFTQVTNSGKIYQKIRRGIMTPGFQEPLNVSNYDDVGGDCSFEDRFYSTNPTGWGHVVMEPRLLKEGIALDWTVTMRR